MDTFLLLVPGIALAALTIGCFLVYCGLHAIGRGPRTTEVKHNQLLGPFMAGFLVWWVSPIERALARRVTPNQITALSLAMCGLTGLAAGLGALGWAMWAYGAAGTFDVLDGRLARLSGKQTVSGALFDSVSDRWGELFVFAGYAWFVHDTLWLLAAFGACGASMMVSYTRARAEGLGIELSGGMMQRAERILMMIVGSLFAVLAGSSAVPVIGITMLIVTATSTATAINRWIFAFRVLAQREAETVAVVPISLTPVVTARTSTELRTARAVEQH